MKINRVLICGSRAWSDVGRIESFFDDWVGKIPHTERVKRMVITGGARGADQIADRVADRFGVQRVVIPANWTGYGRSAGPKRNALMLDLMEPDYCVAFRSPGESRGTDSMIALCRARGVDVVVVSP